MIFEGKTALVTGSSRGIGRCIALALADEGADIVVTYVRRHKAAEEVAAEVEKRGRKATVLRVDVTRPEQIDEMFDAVTEQIGHLDVFVSNAVSATIRPLATIPDRHWDRVIEANLGAFFRASRRAATLMDGRGGADRGGVEHRESGHRAGLRRARGGEGGDGDPRALHGGGVGGAGHQRQRGVRWADRYRSAHGVLGRRRGPRQAQARDGGAHPGGASRDRRRPDASRGVPVLAGGGLGPWPDDRGPMAGSRPWDGAAKGRREARRPARGDHGAGSGPRRSATTWRPFGVGLRPASAVRGR